MTHLKKPVRRTVPIENAAKHGPADIIVTLYPAGLIGFREKRRKQEYVFPLSHVFWLAVKAHVEAERKAKKKYGSAKPC